jgi:hypothetical protein
MCQTVVETNVLLTLVDVCVFGFSKASRYVVLNDCFVSVVLGTKLQSEQGQGEGVHGRRPEAPALPPLCIRYQLIDRYTSLLIRLRAVLR